MSLEHTETGVEHREPTAADVDSYLFVDRNWGRWGPDDERGTVNLITPETRLVALASARTGVPVSLSRPVPTWVGPGNNQPAQHFMKIHHGVDQNTVHDGPTQGGAATDFYGMQYHGVSTTHLDALCHAWDKDGIYNGRDPHEVLGTNGASFAGVETLSDGILTRGVLLDVPAYRGVDYVTQGEPVHGWELEEIVARSGIELRAGDALCVYSGRERWQADNPDKPYGRYPIVTEPGKGSMHFEKPGLHASCLPFLRKSDASVLVWDMLDVTPYPYDVAFTVHGALHAYGLILIDNALLEPLALACRQEQRSDFLFTVAPLVVNGGTGSPVNPVAVL
jgi:kynurenine formamidase